ncbi:hypothetical protein B0I00_2564 [Novosphingobium kunmingense]|uniref:PAS domain-containing protein n=1 Tax=Novosphingobium kunmingense TaxID=1211806 RepID=A0A2N0H4S2_9SPHN|nr:hypothetical protein [Novosphingobium kunmingense]PKB13936.1 hypothetical protein B0I00_2564 [Novosphingobium kunmingense]
MDTYRGSFLDRNDLSDDWPVADSGDDETVNEVPPSPVGQDERRMQVRAYNHWASLLDNRNFPSIEDLEPENLPDFAPYSVLLDFTQGIDQPSIRYLGDRLAAECGGSGEIETLDDVPSRSLLSRITDHYMQILANQAPIGFEAEFVNQRDQTVLYRGILLPFSSDDDTIDFIYGVINWKELADQRTTDALLNEIDEALEVPPATEARREDPMPDWADGPAEALAETGNDSDEPLNLADFVTAVTTGATSDDDDVLDLGSYAEDGVSDPTDLPEPAFATGGWSSIVAATDDDEEDDEPLAAPRPIDFHSIDSDEFAPASIFAPASDEADMGLADWLASARELAEVALGSEDRTRSALYAAIGRAYDFSLAAAEAPDDFAELIADSGLVVQDRAQMTPVVKLVFGSEYDKTRLAEYAAALSHGHRVGVAKGELGRFLAEAPGGLKGVVGEERRLKREESGKEDVRRDTPREALARKLRKLDHAPLDAVAAEGSEFTLLIARRLPSGEVVLLGEIADDVPLLERAAKKLLG